MIQLAITLPNGETHIESGKGVILLLDQGENAAFRMDGMMSPTDIMAVLVYGLESLSQAYQISPMMRAITMNLAMKNSEALLERLLSDHEIDRKELNKKTAELVRVMGDSNDQIKS